MGDSLRLVVFRRQDKLKREELTDHINRLERLILQDDSELKIKEIISALSGQELSDYEIDNHLEDVDSLEKFEDIIRAQMLVSICGYFEYAVKRALNQCQVNLLTERDDLKSVIKKLYELEVIEFSVNNTLEEYRIIRNLCVHSNSISKEDKPKLVSASKHLKVMKLEHFKSSEQYKGKGKIKLEKEFLPNALNLHFDTITKVHEYIVKNKA